MMKKKLWLSPVGSSVWRKELQIVQTSTTAETAIMISPSAKSNSWCTVGICSVPEAC